MSLRLTLPKFRSLTPTFRALSTSAPRYTSAGYGDPQDEKMENNTPTPSSTPHPTQSGSTDPEVAQKTGNSAGSSGKDKSSEGTQVKETKKLGEEAKKEEVGGAGPIGG